MNIKIEAVGAEFLGDRVLDLLIQAMLAMGTIEKIEAAKVGAILSINAEIDDSKLVIAEDVDHCAKMREVELSIARGARAYDGARRFKL